MALEKSLLSLRVHIMTSVVRHSETDITDLGTVFPHIRPAGIIISHSLQMQVLLENTTYSLHKIIRNAGIIRIAGIIRGRVL